MAGSSAFALTVSLAAGTGAALAAPRRRRRLRPRNVRFRANYRQGTIVVNPRKHTLYLVLGGGLARRYPVGVGKAGRAFRGRARIARKAKWPRWTPTKNMIRREPEKYAKFADGVPGGPGNPLGARALYLYRGNRDTYYRIHGTTDPSSIGRSVSNGCIRMLNAHVKDLYRRVPLGTRVVVL
ncbi:MAG: L,D-transpeptidase [Pseudomonadota bacterium]